MKIKNILAAATAAVIACSMLVSCGESSSDTDIKTSSQASSSVAAADTSSKTDSSLIVSDPSSYADSSGNDNSSKAETSDEKYVEWSVEDLDAFFAANVKGKPIADAQKAINEKFGTTQDKWESNTTGDYSTYFQTLETSVDVYGTKFTEIWISEFGGSGTVDTKNSYAGFYGYYTSKVGADNAQVDLAKSIEDKGFAHVGSPFMLMWGTLNGEVSIGATQYKTSEGRLGMLYWPKNQTAQ